MRRSARLTDFPRVATTYRLTEHFPLLDQAIADQRDHAAGTVRGSGEELAIREGHQAGDKIQGVRSNRGFHQGVYAVVTKTHQVTGD